METLFHLGGFNIQLSDADNESLNKEGIKRKETSSGLSRTETDRNLIGRKPKVLGLPVPALFLNSF
jgi:hypothetical protein